jgi:hypothetical protein
MPATGRLDHSDTVSLMDRLMAVADELGAMTSSVAAARVVKEFHGDRMKRALATYVREFLIAGDSASAAETKGRASQGYGENSQRLRHELEIAEQALADHDAKKIEWESLRSSAALARSIASNI